MWRKTRLLWVPEPDLESQPPVQRRASEIPPPVLDLNVIINTYLQTGDLQARPFFTRVVQSVASGITARLTLQLPPPGNPAALVRPLDGVDPALQITLDTYSSQVTLSAQIVGSLMPFLVNIPLVRAVSLSAALIPSPLLNSMVFTVQNNGTAPVQVCVDFRGAALGGAVLSVIERVVRGSLDRIEQMGA